MASNETNNIYVYQFNTTDSGSEIGCVDQILSQFPCGFDYPSYDFLLDHYCKTLSQQNENNQNAGNKPGNSS